MPESTPLTIDLLTEAVAGGAVALRSITRLQPADGPGGKVFPPTYAVSSGTKYAMEERQIGDKVVNTVLLDSVASQANRAELALLAAVDDGELRFPAPYVDFRDEPDLADLDRISVLEAPHRLADAIFRDSLLHGTLFRLSDIGKAITDARPDNATDLFRYAPTALLFGQWDSTGPKGGLGSRFQRAFVSEIVGHDAQVGRKVSSRIDPLGIERDAAIAYEHQDSKQKWTLDRAEAAASKGKPKLAGKDGRPSEINHGNIPPSIDDNAGGVTISEAVQTVVLSLAALRKLRFAGHSRDVQVRARTAVAALGVASIVYGYEADFDLRSRCLLVPSHPPTLEMIGRNGGAPTAFDINRTAAAQLVEAAASRAAEAGIGWAQDEVVLKPAPKLVELLRRSREASARKEAGDE